MGSIQGGSPPTNGGSANSPNHPVSTPTAADNQSFKPTACVACREKHLKCDALRTCTRCAVQGIPCVYLKSRRGYRGPNASSRQICLSNASDAGGAISEPTKVKPSSIALMPPVADDVISLSLDLPPVSNEANSTGLYTRHYRPNYTHRCMEAFYQYFYNAHPFIPPRHQLLRVLKQTPMEHLQTAISYVGSRYVPGAPISSFALEFESYLLGNKPAPKDASMVQAMLLFALGLHGNNERKRAVEILVKAQTLAIELGMSQREYSLVNGRGSPTCEESLRRTWWELYVVSIMVAGFHGTGTFYHRDSLSNVPLPCEEDEFASGCIPQLHTIEQFNEDSFEDEDIMFSSYAYRIAAAQNLDRILQSKDSLFPDDVALYQLEAHLTNWHLHLPDNKRDLFGQFGTLDEMLFQAHMIANVSSLLLYWDFSPLDGLAVRTITSCTEGSGVPAIGPTSDAVYTRRTIQAASNVSKLVTLPGPLVKHTQFFVCALALSSIIHLSLWVKLPVMAQDHDLKQQIRINTGALKAVASLWPSAGIGLKQVTMVAQNIYANRKDAAGEKFWRDFIEDDLMGELIKGTVSIDT
ncbi:uncharacterized protein BP5553_07433 [Venustampulla echinocandica]|uniref:Zn(2)-C6 fungal-type domain-containing protein n=1 Tax=Venustampulla echinocandica TaxID=2656787 RepID=A0A370TGJ4_9HELO|nr:uncharacterized protein BP5553_07433 [Venustampulla echinocandica]RDL34305.1 hypothetical protein BP5553_07433 [Venustampulla echinocandica]